MHHEYVEEAIPGDNVGLCFGRTITKWCIKKGYVVSDIKNDPAIKTETFVAKIIILNHPG